MDGAMRRLLGSAIDYAGLFPPARLSIADAASEYLRYRHGPEQWILGRFVCGAGRLHELLTELYQHEPDEVGVREPLSIAVVGTAQPDRKHWTHGLEHDIDALSRFQDRAERRAELTAFEIRVPDHEHLQEYLRSMEGMQDLDVFFELPWGPAMADSLAMIAEAGAFGAKARTGGLEAAAFPTSMQLAEFIQTCVHLDLQFKCTAGLHHALHHFDSDLKVGVHGFVNVLTAAVLADSDDLSRREIEDVLNDESVSSFEFAADTLVWRGHRASSAQIDAARQLMVGFGSCSVAEPLADLELWAGAVSR